MSCSRAGKPAARQSLARKDDCKTLVGFGDGIGKNGEIQTGRADDVDRNVRSDGIIVSVCGS